MLRTTIRFRDPECVMATFGPVLLMFWKKGGTGAAIKEVHRLSLELGRAHREGIAHVSLVGRTTGAQGISEESRQGILAVLRDRNVPLVAGALVLPGDGFVSALVRSILSGAMLLARSKVAYRFVRTVPEAEAFLRSPGKIGDVLKVPRGALISAVAAVREDLGEEAADFPEVTPR